MEIGFLSRSFQLQKHHNKDTKQFVSLLSRREKPPPFHDGPDRSFWILQDEGEFRYRPSFQEAMCVNAV